MEINPRTVLHSIISFVALLLILVDITLMKSVDVFGLPSFFAIGLLVELLLLIIFAYSLIWAFRTPLRILGSILLSAWSGVLTNRYVKRIKESKSPIYKWVVVRLNSRNPYGLFLSIGAFVALYFLFSFCSLLQAVWFHNPITRIDTRVLNLMPSIRTPLQTSLFRSITFTANIESILLLMLLAGGILWRKGQKFASALLFVAFMAEESSTFLIKHVVRRIRPELSLSLIKEDGFGFPSGHVLRATVIFGLLSYLVFRSIKSSFFRLCLILGYIIAVALIALSRVYLGVHYPSDVLASILFGACLLTLLIMIVEITIRFNLKGQTLKSFTNKPLIALPVVVVIVALIAGPILIKITPVTATPTFTTLSMINDTTVKKMPLYSETLTGKTMEPINFIYVGSEQQIKQLFLSHGWYKADPSTISNTLKALAVGFQGHQYINAPVTPSYLNAKSENIAFQKPTDSNSLRQRHHTRLWRTDFRLSNGQEIWVATASYDEGIEFAGPAKLPTHHIDPNIDAERSYIVSSLGLTRVSYVQVVNPQAGKNASGDTFFTDGRAVLTKF